MCAHVIVLSSPGSHLRRISHDYELIERVDLMLHVVVFTILCENLLKIYSLPFGNVLPKLWNKAVGESKVLPQLWHVFI